MDPLTNSKICFTKDGSIICYSAEYFRQMKTNEAFWQNTIWWVFVGVVLLALIVVLCTFFSLGDQKLVAGPKRTEPELEAQGLASEAEDESGQDEANQASEKEEQPEKEVFPEPYLSKVYSCDRSTFCDTERNRRDSHTFGVPSERKMIREARRSLSRKLFGRQDAESDISSEEGEY